MQKSSATYPRTLVRITTSVPWHALPATESFKRLVTSEEGLTDEEATRRLAEFGPNLLPTKKPPTIAAIFARQFLNPLVYILVIAASISLYADAEADAIFIGLVLIINAIVGTAQEWKAEHGAAALRSLLKSRVQVRRNWTEREIDAESVVPGDIVLLESGNRVPADMRIIEASGAFINEAFLTGESMPVEKKIEPGSETAPLGDRHCMAFAGSTVVRGRVTGVVVATGQETEVGKIAESLVETESGKVTLLVRMERFTKEIGLVVLLVSVFVATISLARGMPLVEVTLFVIGMAVSSIPEGLPVAITVALSISTSRMAARNVLVRRLSAVEGLGSCTYIASDKTGTLTANVQHAKIISLIDRRYDITGPAYEGVGKINGATALLKPLITVGVLVNEAHLAQEGSSWVHHGDTIEVALLALAYKSGTDPELLRAQSPLIAQVPYESEKQYSMASYEQDAHVIIGIKGAFEAVINRCTRMLTSEGEVAIDPKRVSDEVLALAEQGYRVLALAHKTVSSRAEAEVLSAEPIHGFTLVGLVGFIDPPRLEAKHAIATCKRAGIRVGIITGDHPATALAIGREVGVASIQEEVVTGAELEELGGPETPAFLERVRSARVFARVTPLMKLHIVQALTRLGETVAVTGDGVNDAPALRAASIGVAMGSGSDVAKDTASLVITDDNFSSIVAGVEEGRIAYENIRKVINLLISTGAAELSIFILTGLVGLPLPLFAVQLLWLNLVTNGVQHVMLAAEGGEPDIMTRTPRPPREGIFNRRMIEQVLVAGLTIGLVGFFSWWWMMDAGWNQVDARNMLLLILVFFENVHVFSCRSERFSVFTIPLSRNYWLIVGVILAQSVHFLAMHWRPLGDILRLHPVTIGQWMTALTLGITVLLTMEAYKLVRRRFVIY